MRSYSLLSIVLLCVFILIIDALAFYWLQSITRLLDSAVISRSIHIFFWIFSIGLVVSILILKIRLDSIDPVRKHLWISSFYGLTVASLVPKILFVVVISILYYSNYFFSSTESMVVIALGGIVSGLIPFVVILYGIFKAAYRFKVYHHVISFEALPEAFDGLRIVQISDIHLGNFNYRYAVLERAVEEINRLEPDYVFLTGDLINNYSWELRGWETVFAKISAAKGKISILGNHDYGDYSQWETAEAKEENFAAVKRFYQDTGFELLMNEAVIVEEADEVLAIIGVENWGAPPFKQYGNLKLATKEIQHIPFKILLSHDPTHWQEVLQNTDIALTLSGHTHGMQAGFQFRKKQWSPIKFKYKHWAGLYREGAQYLYVNRGLGWLGFPGRIGMRPEITLLELSRSS